jgi:hypothetical protein
MRAPVKILAVGTPSAILVSLLLCGAATSQTVTADPAAPNQVLNNQVQLGDVVAGQTLDVQTSANGATVVTTALANSVTGVAQGSAIGFESQQSMSGATTATSQPSVNGDAGPSFVASTSATGNSSTAGTSSAAATGDTTQTNSGTGTSAATFANMGGFATVMSVGSTAVGNTANWSVSSGSLNATATQTNAGTTHAESDVTSRSVGTGTYTATAVTHDAEADTTSSPVQILVGQTQSGASTDATAYANQGDAGNFAVAATATANNANVVSDSYSALAGVTQDNEGAVSATANGVVGSWGGNATSTAYGVGNSTLVSNAGSYTNTSNAQTNTGAITVSASLTSSIGGGAGSEAVVNATGVGNAVSAYGCASCNATFVAHNTQVNKGSVHSTATTNTYGVNSVTGVSSAIGNTATYQVVGSDN